MGNARNYQPMQSVMLPAPPVQYGDGKIVTSPAFNLEDVLADFLRLQERARSEFLSIFAHSLTVDMRAALLDRPVSEKDAEKAYQINEWLHQLTSSLNPTHSRGVAEEAGLIRDIAAESFRYGLEGGVGRAVMAGKSVIARSLETLVSRGD